MLAKLLLPLLAFASVALGTRTESPRVDGPRLEKRLETLFCSIDAPRINETWDHDTVFRACQHTTDWMGEQTQFHLSPYNRFTIAYDMCATKISSLSPTDLVFNPSELAALISREILYKCIMGDWWGTMIDGTDYMVSMQPYVPPPPPKQLQQEPVKQVTTIQHGSAQGSLSKRDAKRYLSDGQLECSGSDRHLQGKECNEAYNTLFDGILWLDHMFIDANACRAANSTGNTCTVSICNLSGQGATYHVPQLLDRLAMNISWPCVEWQDKAAYWTDGMTSIFMG